MDIYFTVLYLIVFYLKNSVTDFELLFYTLCLSRTEACSTTVTITAPPSFTKCTYKAVSGRDCITAVK